jgi:Flp pilus assembly protein TadD
MMAGRFLYGTLVGVLPLLLGAVGNLDVGNNFRWAVFGTLVLAVPLVLVDRARTNVWRDNASFFETLALQLPDDPSAQIRQAAEELKRGEPESALARLQRLPERRVALLFPRDRALLRYWHGRALLAAGKAAEAAAELQRAERFLPEDQVALELSEALARSGHLQAAEARLRQYLKAAPGDDAAWNGLGNVQWMAGDRPGAASSYREALRLNPENKEAGINLARLEGEDKR